MVAAIHRDRGRGGRDGVEAKPAELRQAFVPSGRQVPGPDVEGVLTGRQAAEVGQAGCLQDGGRRTCRECVPGCAVAPHA